MQITRDYLTCAEIKFVIDEMLQKATPLERYIIREALIAQILTDGVFAEGLDCVDIYNQILEDGIKFDNVRGYDVINEVVAQYDSPATVIRTMCADLSEKLDASLEEIKKFNIEDVKKTLIDK